MWLSIVFIAIGYVLTYLALKSKGKFLSLIFMVLAFGFALTALPFIVYTNPTHIPQQNITTSSGNIIIHSYNITSNPTKNALQFELGIAELNGIIEFALVMLIIGFLFFESRLGKRKRFAEKGNNNN